MKLISNKQTLAWLLFLSLVLGGCGTSAPQADNTPEEVSDRPEVVTYGGG